MAGILKRVVSVLFVTVFLYVPAFGAPPANPDIPKDLLQEKLLSTYVKQMVIRAKYWRAQIGQANSTDGIFAVRDDIIKDYNLYNAVNYQKEYAKITEALYMPIFRGQLDLIKGDDPLATVKIINIAVIFSEMNPAYMEKGLEEMLSSSNQAVRYIGWQGMKKNRNAELSVGQLKTLYSSAQDVLAKETNPNIISEVLQAIDFGTSATQSVPEKFRKAAASKTIELVLEHWKKFVSTVPTADSDNKLIVPEIAIATLANNAAFVGDDKQKNQAISLVFAQAQVAVDRFTKLQDAIKSVKARLEKLKIKPDDKDQQVYGRQPAYTNPNEKTQEVLTPEQKRLNAQLAELDSISGDYKVFLMSCEDAFNTLTGAQNDFIARQMTASADPAAAMKLGLLDWQAALKSDAK